MNDHTRITELLGRSPRGAYEVVVRSETGDPMVIRNAPFLDDGTPMPTRYWLIDPDESRRIGRIESAGGVDRAEQEIPADVLAAAHARYAAERDAAIPDGHDGPRPSGGVGGTRTGLKCLHAHWAWHLAGGDDPVGRWIEAEIDRLAVDRFRIGSHEITVDVGGDLGTGRATIPWGADSLSERWLSDDDPPLPEALTNALGTIDDELDDLERAHPGVGRRVGFTGQPTDALVALEAGRAVDDGPHLLDRSTIEEVFRLVAMQPASDRADEPGLPSRDVTRIVGTCCIVLAVMRRFQLADATFDVAAAASARGAASGGAD